VAVHPTNSSPQVEQARDPIAAIQSIQRAQQRFWRGLPLTVVAAVLLAPLWAFTLSPLQPLSKPRIVGALLGGAVVGLPLRVLGRVVEVRLALVAGVLAALAIWLGDYFVQSMPGSGPALLLSRGTWWISLITYAGAGWVATIAARNELAVELSQAEQHVAGVAILAPHIWEDPNAVVLDEAANFYRGWVAVPGKLRLSSRNLQFFERGGQAASPFIPLDEVEAAHRSALPNAMTVALLDGTTHRFVTNDPDKWIVQINARLGAARGAALATR
jgi:hypothetical protein